VQHHTDVLLQHDTLQQDVLLQYDTLQQDVLLQYDTLEQHHTTHDRLEQHRTTHTMTPFGCLALSLSIFLSRDLSEQAQ